MGKHKNNDNNTAADLLELCNLVAEMRRLQQRAKTERTSMIAHAIVMAERKVDTAVARINLTVTKKTNKSKPFQPAFNWLAQ